MATHDHRRHKPPVYHLINISKWEVYNKPPEAGDSAWVNTWSNEEEALALAEKLQKETGCVWSVVKEHYLVMWD